MNESLASALCRLPPDHTCVLAGQRQLTVQALLDEATTLRQQVAAPGQATLALHGLPLLQLLIALAAFDGQVAAMLLLPASLDTDTADRLIQDAGCHLQIRPGLQTRPLVPVQPLPGQPTGETTWLLATSGTTGTPKLIRHNLRSLSRSLQRDHRKGQQLTWGLAYDPCRFAGLQVLLQSLLGGSRLALPEQASFDSQVQAFLDAGINALSATPSLWRKLLMDGRIHALPLRQITLGGEITDQPVLDALRAAYPQARIVHIYASTEAGTGFAVKDGKAGFPAAWLNGSASGTQLKLDNAGHLLLKPEVLPQGEAIQARLTPDGYLDTEDLVVIQQERALFLGRASGAINVGGNKVNPEQVETCLRQVPGIVDARVYGKASSMMGQLVAADLATAPGFDQQHLRQQLLQHCKQHLEAWQRPMLMNFVDQLHITPAGKKERQTP